MKKTGHYYRVEFYNEGKLILTKELLFEKTPNNLNIAGYAKALEIDYDTYKTEHTREEDFE